VRFCLVVYRSVWVGWPEPFGSGTRASTERLWTKTKLVARPPWDGYPLSWPPAWSWSTDAVDSRVATAKGLWPPHHYLTCKHKAKLAPSMSRRILLKDVQSWIHEHQRLKTHPPHLPTGSGPGPDSCHRPPAPGGSLRIRPCLCQKRSAILAQTKLLAQGLPDTRSSHGGVHVRFLCWWGLLLFYLKLGSHRQLDFQLRDDNSGSWTMSPAGPDRTESLPVNGTLSHFLGHVGSRLWLSAHRLRAAAHPQ